MTLSEAYTSLKSLYKNMMFPQKTHAPKWTMTEIDQLDVHFFSELMDEDNEPVQKEEEQYLSAVW